MGKRKSPRRVKPDLMSERYQEVHQAEDEKERERRRKREGERRGAKGKEEGEGEEKREGRRVKSFRQHQQQSAQARPPGIRNTTVAP